MAKMCPVEDRRDARGRWLPGAIPPGGDTPVVVGERRQRIIDALMMGQHVEEAAQAAGVGERTVWRAMHDDEELRQAHLHGAQVRRWQAARGIQSMLDRVVAAGQNDERAQDAMRRAIAIGTLLDAHAKAVGLYQPWQGVNIAVQVHVPRHDGTTWTLGADE